MERNLVTLKYEKGNEITGQNLPYLWQYIQQEKIWQKTGRCNKILQKESLFAILWEYFRKAHPQKLLPFESKEIQEAFLRNVWGKGKPGCPPQGFKYNEQYKEQYSNLMPYLSHEIALEAQELSNRYNANRCGRISALGDAIVPQIALEIFLAINAKLNHENNSH